MEEEERNSNVMETGEAELDIYTFTNAKKYFNRDLISLLRFRDAIHILV